MVSPPSDVAQLLTRAGALAGRDLTELGARAPSGSALHEKGKLGEIFERLLGATGGPTRAHDFPELGVELKSIPVSASGAPRSGGAGELPSGLRPRESTFVCAFAVGEAERAEWETSWVRAKLAKVLFLPVVFGEAGSRTVGRAVLWSPSPDEEAVLKADFDEIVGAIGTGGIEGVSARLGEALQLRPKGRNARDVALLYTGDGEPVWTMKRGFYLRATFTEKILQGSLDAGSKPR